MTVAVDDSARDAPMSLWPLLDPQVLANPFPLYRRLREAAPVLWDPFLHAWIVTGYEPALTVLHRFSAERLPKLEQLRALGLSALEPIARLMLKQMLFMDGAAHARLHGLCSAAFMPRQVEQLRPHIQEIADSLVDSGAARGEMDLIDDFAGPLPAIVTAELLGISTSDHKHLRRWSADFAEILGNLQHNPDRVAPVERSVAEMVDYFRAAIREIKRAPREGLINRLLTTSVDGSRLDEEEVLANTIITMTGGQETTTNLIGNGVLTLLRHPEALAELRDNPSLTESAVEELLRFESPIQHTGRLAPENLELCGQRIQKRDAVMVVMAAANRDPSRFPEPDRLILTRTDNRHLAFGWGPHFCFGAPLARAEANIAFPTLLRRLPGLALAPQTLEWRGNQGLRGLKSLRVTFEPSK